MNTNKPLSEWTLAEVNAECKKYEICGPECPAYINEYECAVRCRLRFAPSTWDLTEPPRWTEQDKEDARMVKKVAHHMDMVFRNEQGVLFMYRDFVKVQITQELFPSLKPGESATLDEIIGGGE